MEFDYEEMEGDLSGFCCYSEEAIQEGLEKLKSMSEDEIKSLSKALENALDEEWSECIDDLLNDEHHEDEFFYASMEDYLEPYFEKYPNEKMQWEENRKIDKDLFVKYLQDNNYFEKFRNDLETVARDHMSENGYIEQISIDSCGKVAEVFRLPGTIIYHLYSTGQLPL